MPRTEANLKAIAAVDAMLRQWSQALAK